MREKIVCQQNNLRLLFGVSERGRSIVHNRGQLLRYYCDDYLLNLYYYVHNVDKSPFIHWHVGTLIMT